MKPLRTLLRNAVAAILVAITAFAVADNTGRWHKQQVIENDVLGYYAYLPAALVYGDLLNMQHLRTPGDDTVSTEVGYGLFTVPATGHVYNKYPYGNALSMAPAFLVAHAVDTLRNPDTPFRAYAPPYQLAVVITSILCTVGGLLITGRYLRRFLSPGVTTLTLLAIGWGTNLFHYSSILAGYTHPLLFLLFAVVLERSDAWYRNPRRSTALVLGLTLGWIAVIRPVDVLVAIVPLAYALGTARWKMPWQHRSHLALLVGAALLPLIPQLLLWKLGTGHWLHWSYGEEAFHFSAPHIVDGLFSFRKGWFIYTPLAFVAFLGCFSLWKRPALRPYVRMLLCFYLPFLWVVFSWWSWWYGGSFGSRPMIQTLPLLSLPLGMLISDILRQRALVRTTSIILIAGCVILNLFQQWQYLNGIIHHSDMDLARYRAAWGRTTLVTPDTP